MIVTICHKDTGRKMKRMEESSLTIVRLLEEGHTRVESVAPSPQHIWKDEWILDAALVEQVKTVKKTFELASTDQYLARITEDLIGILVAKGLLSLDDFSPKTKEKLSERAALRG